ncbi:MAG TPA: DegQ family serine endoprotease [Parvularculaceae bacterium]|nr:DegQ family serine endoprotease [Caulobacterales bacterium]HPE29637.1 DegQ family serine endoprotease [Parvularculaceae bacterium]
MRFSLHGLFSVFAILAACSAPAESAPPVSSEMKGETIEGAQRVAPQSMAEVHLSFAPIVEKTSPAVVNVFTRSTINRTTGDPFFDRFFNVGPREQQSLGSGVIVSPDGVIVTNNHVIDGAQEIKVVFADRREFAAKKMFTDPQTDVAVLKIEAGEALPFLEFGNSDALEVGDVVLAIGNPFGVGQTVTSGIVSALARTAVSISDYQFFIQTDAAINPGNSGGALVDINGNLIGINTAIYSRSGGSNGIGFAIPARLVQQVIRSAMNGGELKRPWIGASTDSVSADVARVLKLDRPAGAIVSEIWPGGPAAAAGIKDGDVITEIDGEPVYDAATLRYRVGIKGEDETTELVYVRDGKPHKATVKLKLPPDEPGRDPRKIEGNNPLDGVTVDNLSPRFNEQVGLDPFRTGVVVTEIDRGAYAARSGLRRGYRILSVNGKKVSTAAELEREIKAAGTRWVIEIDTGNRVATWRVGR